MQERRLTLPEALVSSAWCVLALIIVAAYLWARVGPLQPFALLGAFAAAAVVVTMRLLRDTMRETGASIASVVLLVTIGCWLLWLASPSLLPGGGGPDLAHHLLLVDYLERHWQLPDATLVGVMGEMAHYTPGLHLLAALGGAWIRGDGLHVIYPIVALTVALKSVVVFLIALRTLPAVRPRIPLALAAVLLAFVPQVYVTGSFLHDSFLAQAAAELFAVAMWWAVVVWDAAPARTPVMLFAAAGGAAFLTWPVWVGAPIVALTAVVMARSELPVARRLQDLAIAVLPVLLIAAFHAAGRTGWIAVAGTERRRGAAVGCGVRVDVCRACGRGSRCRCVRPPRTRDRAPDALARRARPSRSTPWPARAGRRRPTWRSKCSICSFTRLPFWARWSSPRRG